MGKGTKIPRKTGSDTAKKPVLRELSDWQALRVRNALRAYHRYGRDSDGRYFTWRDVREAVALYTGVQVGTSLKNGAERLRQFVEGVEDPGFRRKFPMPKPDALAGIVQFVTDPELALLSEEELAAPDARLAAPMRLLEFMREDCTLPENEDLRHLQGHYFTIHPNRDGWTTRNLFFQRLHDDGVLQLTEVRDHFASDTREQALEWASETGRALSSQKFHGWALLTPEDSLVLFLKREQDGKNHRYLCLEEVGVWLQLILPKYIEPKDASRSIKILMMEHEFGHDLQGASKKEIADSFFGDLFVFSKLSGAPD